MSCKIQFRTQCSIIYINKNVNICLFKTGNLRKFLTYFFEILTQRSNRIWECLYIVVMHYLPISIWTQLNDYFFNIMLNLYFRVTLLLRWPCLLLLDIKATYAILNILRFHFNVSIALLN